MIQTIFMAVAHSLLSIAKKLNISYNQINIIVYYLLIPFSWTIMLDSWIELPITTAILGCIWIGIWIGIFIATHNFFREWCDWVFKDSVDFPNWFNRWGGNYVLNSVIICVVIPVLVYIGLLFLML